MAIADIFVGREAELSRFKEILEDPTDHVILIVGHQGMGKTALIGQMEKEVSRHAERKSVHYRITPSDTPDIVMASILADIEQASRKAAGFFDVKGQRDKIMALLNLPSFLGIGSLISALLQSTGLTIREKFISALNLLSERLPNNGRFVLFIDPDPYLARDSADSYRIVAENIPTKIKFCFAQRPDDEIAANNDFGALPNLIFIPSDGLKELNGKAVADFVDLASPAIRLERETLLSAIEKYKGHPYAVSAALELLADGAQVFDLPPDPTPRKVSMSQWQRIADKGSYAVCLFQAYAVLEVPVPKDVVIHVSDISPAAFTSLVTGDRFIASLLREEGQGRLIYHDILARHILSELSENAVRTYHKRACEAYRDRLKSNIKPDELAAVRLPVHVRAAEGESAFAECIINECGKALQMAGLLDVFTYWSKYALHVTKSSEVQATLLNNLGIVYQMRGDLDEAEKIYWKALKIHAELCKPEGIAASYGNLGIVYKTRGNFNDAKKMYLKALEINERLGRRQGIAANYGNLGDIHRIQGDLDEAEKMYRKALEIEKVLGRLDGIADAYNSLGIVHKTRGDLADAEKMYLKAVEIDQRLGRQHGIAANYGNLGNIYQIRGDLDEAEKMFRRALEISERLGGLEGMAASYCNLGNVYQIRGDLDNAEKMCLKALAINERLSRPIGIANNSISLGNIHQVRGGLDEAEKMYRKALEIDELLGRLDGIAAAYENLGTVYRTRGDLDEAKLMYRKALDFFGKLGATKEIESIKRLLNEIGER